MPNILLTNYYPAGPLEILKAVVPKGFQLITLEVATRENFMQKVRLAEYFLASGRLLIDGEVLNAAVKLKMIQRTGVGTDSLDFDALRERNIPVYVNRGVNANSVAEHTMLLILSSLRQLPTADRNTKSGIWKKQEFGITTNELEGKIVGLLGLGNIGQRVAEMLRPFHVKTLYYDISRLTKSQEDAWSIEYCPFEDMIKQVDILSLHCALTEETRNILSAHELSRMKDDVILINTSRGGLIEEKALVDALRAGKVKCAGLDVFATEPVQHDNELLTLGNVVATPHIGGVTYEAFRRMMFNAMQNIVQFESGKRDFIQDKRIL